MKVVIEIHVSGAVCDLGFQRQGGPYTAGSPIFRENTAGSQGGHRGVPIFQNFSAKNPKNFGAVDLIRTMF